MFVYVVVYLRVCFDTMLTSQAYSKTTVAVQSSVGFAMFSNAIFCNDGQVMGCLYSEWRQPSK